MVGASTRATAQTQITQVHVFSDVSLDLNDDASIAKAFALSPSSPRIAHLRRLLMALSRNAAMKQVLDDATNPAKPSGFELAKGRLGGVAGDLLQHGLPRLDDRDLLRYRALAKKDFLLTGTRDCPPNRSRQLKNGAEHPELVEPDWETMLDVWTLAVDAVNNRRPVLPVTDEQFEEAKRVAAEAMSDEDRAALSGLRLKESTTVTCADIAMLERLPVEAPPDASVILMRRLFAIHASASFAGRTYRAGESLQYPAEAIRANVTGDQTIRISVDAVGKVTEIKVVDSHFTPSIIARTDGTTITTSALFEREIVAYLQVAGHPPRVKDGRPVAADFEFPIKWQLED